MKRIIALILLIATLVVTTFASVSCDLLKDYFDQSLTPSDGVNKPDKPTDGNTGNNTDNNTDNKPTYPPVVPDCDNDDHIDEDNNDYCDLCNEYVVVVIDFYVFNDLHGKFCDTDSQPGVDEFGSFIEDMNSKDDNIVLLSSGDMWQGSAESTLSFGAILVDWMNLLGFEAMTLGNHEFDWGEDAIRDNLEKAEFPFLAINVYDNNTGKLADYCTPSIMIERDGVQIGIIGAIGDCYSSISSDMVSNVHFKVGSQLTALVKAESQKLRDAGADLIVYSLHDGTEGYDSALSNGYVDIVFEGHTHSSYTRKDSYGVYHVQGGGENKGISHAEIAVNPASHNNNVTQCRVISSYTYSDYEDHPETEALEDKYSDLIEYAYADLGIVSKNYSDSEIEDFVAQLYLEAGIERWGDEYDVILGGGFLRTRTPYDLSSGVKRYADLLSLFPFNNKLALCSIQGRYLKSKFINSSSNDYHVAISQNANVQNISDNGIYYVVVDTYTALYGPNRLTIVDFYDETTYARDLLADAIVAGRLETKHEAFSLTSIKDVLDVGSKLSVGQSSSEYFYIKGVIKDVPSEPYGNFYLVDEYGNEIYVYGLNDSLGNKYGYIPNKPVQGDTIIVCSKVYRYTDSVIELKAAELVSVE